MSDTSSGTGALCVSRIQSKSKPVAHKRYSEKQCVPLATFPSKLSYLDQKREHCSDQTYIKWAFTQKHKSTRLWLWLVTVTSHKRHTQSFTHTVLFISLLRKCIYTWQQLRVRCCCFKKKKQNLHKQSNRSAEISLAATVCLDSSDLTLSFSGTNNTWVKVQYNDSQ